MRLIISLFLMLPLLGLAQDFEYAGYSWEDKPIIHELSEEEQQLASVILKDERVIEYQYVTNDEGNDELVQFYTEHKIIRVHDDKALEEFNKVFIPMYNTIELIDLQARSVTKDGRVVEVTKDNIKELENLENAGAYKLFAIEGLEKGGEVEYFYTLKNYPKVFGREVYQSDVLTKDASFTLITPTNLIFETKGYNGIANTIDTMKDEKIFLSAKLGKIEPLFQEKYASYNANLKRIEYKLAYNLFMGNERLLTWEGAADKYRNTIFKFSKEELKQGEKMLSELKLKKLKDEEKIIALEKHIKTNINLQEGYSDQFELIDKVLENKFANEYGFQRLFAGLFNLLGIEYQLVLTTDRYRYRFDKDFETWNYLDETVFYFPQYDKFLSPHTYDHRYGLIPHQLTNNYGLFFSPEKTGPDDVKIKLIPPVDVQNHSDDLSVKVAFPESMEFAKLSVRRSMSGYRANFIQPIYNLLPEETQQQFVEAILKSSGEDANIASTQVFNADQESIYENRPMVIEGEMEISSLIDKAGRKYLFKVGEVIGAQVEMYQKGERQSEVEFEYPHMYKRIVSIEKPEGYAFKGLEDINIDIRYNDEQGNPSMGFVSDYVLKGDLLTINITEYYNDSQYPVTRFEEFRKVINAAADFNKVVLVLEEI